MKSVWLNRLATLLAWGGMFVAGVLSWSHHTGTLPPCGLNKGGCESVATHPSSIWFGIPVADFGLAAYLVLAIVALGRELATGQQWRRFSLAGAVVSGAGFLASAWLTYVAIAVIRATCTWCLASAGMMAALFVVGMLLLREGPPVRRPGSGLALATTALGIIAALGGLGMTVPNLAGTANNVDLGALTVKDLMPESGRILGQENAPITIVEFSDLNCPSCRSTFGNVKVILKNGGGKIRLGFRHFPMFEKEGHETSLPGAVIAQYASKKGKFWEFMTLVMAESSETRAKTEEGLLAMATEVGLDEGGVAAALSPDSPETTQVIEDFNMVQTLGIRLTPTYLVVAEGAPPRIASPGQLAQLLGQSPYREMIGGR